MSKMIFSKMILLDLLFKFTLKLFLRTLVSLKSNVFAYKVISCEELFFYLCFQLCSTHFM